MNSTAPLSPSNSVNSKKRQKNKKKRSTRWNAADDDNLSTSAADLWALQNKSASLARKIENLLVEKTDHESGILASALLLTPRFNAKDRTQVLSQDKKADLRRDAREKRMTTIKRGINTYSEQLRQVEDQILWDTGKRLPLVHRELLRNAVVDVRDEARIKAHIETENDDINRRSINGWTSLHIAANQGHEPMVKFLVGCKGIDLDVQDNAGYTALHYACMFGYQDIAQELLRNGADMTVHNREARTAIQVAGIMGHNVIAQTLFDSISISEQARFMAARFYLQIFNGDPDYYHYKTKEHDKLRMVAFLFLFRRELIGSTFSSTSTSTSISTSTSSHLIAQPTQSTNTTSKKQPKTKVDRQLLEQPNKLGPLVFKRKMRSEWQPQIDGWEYGDEALFELISEDVFLSKMTPDQIKNALNNGQTKFKQWMEENAEEILFERRRVAQQAIDALRLQKMRKEREEKKKREQEEADKKRREEMRRQPLDPNAAVIINSEASGTNGSLVFTASNGKPTRYSICLATEPLGTVLVRVVVKSDISEDGSRLKCTPKLVTFVQENWDEPVFISVDIMDDDALVRMKRDLANGRGQHHVINTIQHSTDRNYKQKDLVWKPTSILPILVQE